jgi:hypothetical protein
MKTNMTNENTEMYPVACFFNDGALMKFYVMAKGNTPMDKAGDALAQISHMKSLGMDTKRTTVGPDALKFW